MKGPWPPWADRPSDEPPAGKPPKDFPPNDWAVIRSVGELCRYDERIWRWDGRDWQLIKKEAK